MSYTTCPLVLTIDTRANRETLPPTPAPTISQSMASRRVKPPCCPLSPPSPFTFTFTSTFSFRFPPLPLPDGFDSVKPPWALSRSQLDVEPCNSTRASSDALSLFRFFFFHSEETASSRPDPRPCSSTTTRASSDARSLFRFFFRRFETASRGSLPIFARPESAKRPIKCRVCH